MVGKGVRAVIMGLLILGLVVAQTEAKSCCRNTIGRNCYIVCCMPGTPRPICAAGCDCKIIDGTRCPTSHPRSSMLENSVDVIEEVTTDAEAYPTFVRCPNPTFVRCPNPKAKACFSRCRLARWACAIECGCHIIYPPRDI